MTEWQDISTAPKDGTEILVYFTEHESKIGNILTAKYQNEYWIDPNIVSPIVRLFEPFLTHWMPLPNPPEKKHESQFEDMFNKLDEEDQQKILGLILIDLIKKNYDPENTRKI